MSKGRVTASHTSDSDKRKKSMRDTARQLREFHQKVLKAHDGRPLPDSVSDLSDIREGR